MTTDLKTEPPHAATMKDNPRVVPFNDGSEDLLDQLHRSAAQLSALMHSVTGSGFGNFTSYSGTVQHDLLWLAQGLAVQIERLVEMQLSGRQPEMSAASQS